MEPEFAIMLSYIQELPSKQKPNYKMLKSHFEVIKERNHLQWHLEWMGKLPTPDSSPPRSENSKPRSPVLNKRQGIINVGSLKNRLGKISDTETPPKIIKSDEDS
jgi:hypothetical protein